MKNLVLSSLVFFLLVSSCSPKILKGFHKAETQTVQQQAFYPAFSQTDSTLMFNMQIDFRKNHFSGILFIKSPEKDVYRTVFVSHFGMSIFDFEFKKNEFKINNCIDALNQKRVIETLEKDFRYLFLLNLDSVNSVNTYKNKKNENLEVYKVTKAYYLKNNTSKELLQIEFPHFFSSLYYSFSDYKNGIPSTIKIKHSNIGLKLQLDLINKEESN